MGGWGEYDLKGMRVRLVHGGQENLQGFISFINEIKEDPENFNSFRYREPDVERIAKWVSSWSCQVILALQGDRVVGFSQMADAPLGSLQSHVKELALSVSREFRGSGLAQLLFLHQLTSHPSVRIVLAWTDTRNSRSISMLTKAGMRVVCVMDDFIYSQRERRYVSMAFLRGESPNLKDRLRTYLEGRGLSP